MNEDEIVQSTYKAIAPALSSLPVRDNHGFFNLTVHVEVLAKCLVSGVIRQATHEDLGIGRVPAAVAR